MCLEMSEQLLRDMPFDTIAFPIQHMHMLGVTVSLCLSPLPFPSWAYEDVRKRSTHGIYPRPRKALAYKNRNGCEVGGVAQVVECLLYE
jgi:hypothetical protein